MKYNIKVENEELVDIDSINLDSNYIEIEEGVKKAVKYTINPDNATFTSVDWKVSDTSIVSLGYVGNVMNIEALKEGEQVKIAGFGTFEVKTRAERKGLNPSTKEEIVIAPSKSVGFKASKTLKDQLK